MKKLKQLWHNHKGLLISLAFWTVLAVCLVALTSYANMDYCFNCGAYK